MARQTDQNMDHRTSQFASTVIGHQETENAAAAHTPTPWEFIDATKEASMQYKPLCIINSGEKQIASFSWNDNSPWFPSKLESQANAAFIVKAANSHGILVAALQKIAEGAPETEPDRGDYDFSNSGDVTDYGIALEHFAQAKIAREALSSITAAR